MAKLRDPEGELVLDGRQNADDGLEAHYASLERMCVCIDGWVFGGYEDEYGEQREASYRCRRFASEAGR